MLFVNKTRLFGHAPAIILTFLSISYFFTIFAGILNHDVLPNGYIFKIAPWARMLAQNEPACGHFLLAIGGLGAISSWILGFIGNYSPAQNLFYMFFIKHFLRFGIVWISALYLFSIGGTWAGVPRSQDLAGSAVAGLLPFNDAHGHFQYPLVQAFQGEWNPFLARRPMAAGFRTLMLWLTAYNNINFLLLQTTALAFATFFATRAVVLYRGLWAGFTFFGLVFIVCRPYLPTFLSEPLGIFWALLAIPFFIRAFEKEKIKDIAMGFSLTTWALMIRMGSMFTIPAITIWAFVSQKKLERKKCFCASALILLILIFNLGFNGVLQKLYGKTGSMSGSNFAYVICGLSLGKDWTYPTKIYKDELSKKKTEKEISEYLYKKALYNIKNNKKIFGIKLWQGEMYFWQNLPSKIVQGYLNYSPKLFPASVWWFVVLFGLCLHIKNLKKNEKIFWILFFVSLAVSAPFIIFEDGWRILCVSFPLISLFIASGFSTKQKNLLLLQKDNQRRFKTKAILYFVTSLLMVIAPAYAYKNDLLNVKKIPSIYLKESEDVFLGSFYMAGFYVLPDNFPQLEQVPTIFWSDFKEIIEYSGIEQYEALTTPQPILPPPFGIFAATGIYKHGPTLLLIPGIQFNELGKKPVIMKLKERRFFTVVKEFKTLNSE